MGKDSISSKIRDETRVSSLLLSTVFEAVALRYGKETKGIHIEGDNVPLCVEDRTLELKDPQPSTKKHFTLITTFSREAEYKISV